MICAATKDGITCERGEASHEMHMAKRKIDGVWGDWEYWPNTEYVGPVANAKDRMEQIADRVESRDPEQESLSMALLYVDSDSDSESDIRRVHSTGATPDDEPIERAGAAAPEEWKERAREVVAALAAGGEFTADDVWRQVESPPEPRALGSVINWARRNGMIEPTGRFVPSERAINNHRHIPIWIGTGT